MSEIERILRKGEISRSFLIPEERDGFLVTEDRKKLWCVLLDLLLEFDRVCKRNNLRYYLNSGTLLGAVRHKGFIPWDDDIDVEMPRADYEKLLMLADEFKHPYFLQTPYTDPNSAYTFTKLRNSNTTMASKHFAFQDMNHGVLIDIFPLDKWDASDLRSYDIIKGLAYENSTYMRLLNPLLSENDLRRVRTWAGIDHVTVYEIIQKLAKKYQNEDPKLMSIACVSAPLTKLSEKCRSIEVYSDTVQMKFEDFYFPAPSGFDQILCRMYGDYMKFPPIEERGLWHNDLIIDVDTPYKIYLQKYCAKNNR